MLYVSKVLWIISFSAGIEEVYRAMLTETTHWIFPNLNIHFVMFRVEFDLYFIFFLFFGIGFPESRVHLNINMIHECIPTVKMEGPESYIVIGLFCTTNSPIFYTMKVLRQIALEFCLLPNFTQVFFLMVSWSILSSLSLYSSAFWTIYLACILLFSSSSLTWWPSVEDSPSPPFP